MELNTDLITGITWIDDCNDAVNNGKTYGVSASSANTPVAKAGYIKVKVDAAGNTFQHFSVRGTSLVETYERSKDWSVSTWGDWVKLPTRAEVDKLNTDLTLSHVTDTTGEVEVNYYKYGRVVMCCVNSIESSIALTAWSAISLGTIPTGYRPATSSIGYLPVARLIATNTIPLYFNANESGIIRYINQSGNQIETGTIMRFTAVWIA